MEGKEAAAAAVAAAMIIDVSPETANYRSVAKE
jgi:hypothetical protein